jgi:hypothetical protein
MVAYMATTTTFINQVEAELVASNQFKIDGTS